MLKIKALTLIELIIALLIASALMAAIMSIFLSTVKHSQGTVEQVRLDSELHHVMSAVTKDVRRAGYWSDASSSTTNPFMQSATDITVNGSNNCILMTYDHNADGALPAVSTGMDDERYGYRLSNSIIQFRPHTAAFDCAASASSWTNFTDPNIIIITAFNVVKATETVSSMEVRTITITLTGQLVSNASITKTLTQTIKVQNDRYTP